MTYFPLISTLSSCFDLPYLEISLPQFNIMLIYLILRVELKEIAKGWDNFSFFPSQAFIFDLIHYL